MKLLKSKNQRMIEQILLIHSIINQSSEELAQSAQLGLSTLEVRKTQLMANIGFVNAQGIDNLNRINLYKTVVYYLHKYPEMKFLTHEIFNDICAKYGLVKELVSQYSGDVPLQNLEEIQLKMKQIEECDYVDEYFRITIFDENFDGLGKMNYVIRKKADFDQTNGGLSRLADDLGARYAFSCKKTVEPLNHPALHIAAAPELMTSRKKEIKEFYDPICYFPVHDGLLVLSKWGAEENEPQLTY